jgi:hypothetical protein
MKIEVAVTPIGRTIIVLMGVVALVLAALATQVIGPAFPMSSLEVGPGTTAAVKSVSHLPLFSQAREGGSSVPAAVGENTSHPRLYTGVREGSVPVAARGLHSTFTQVREQSYDVQGVSQPLMTEFREASGYAPVIANRNLPLFAQAREQGVGVNTVGSPLFTQAREG